MFNRSEFFSQTEACRLYKISPKKFKRLIEGIQEVNNTVTIHSHDGKPYEITTIYIKKINLYKIMIGHSV
jgi:hypothetical protein